MAAIAGILRLDDTPRAGEDLRCVLDRLAHRAPDGMHAFVDGSFALGHGACHATPEARFERQPIVLVERWVLAVDGRIDNRDALSRLLELDAGVLTRTGDADLFALAWVRWGSDFWRHIEGDYALAVWDRVAQRLTLLRDRVGVRPLYYAVSSQLVAFASEPEALLGLDGVSRTCDGDALAYLLGAFDFDDQQRTFYRDVRRLPAAWRLEADPGRGARTDCYWRPEPWGDRLPADTDGWIMAFNEAFDVATRSRMRGVDRPTLLLSGGIDSGCVLAAARRLHGQGEALGMRPLSLVESRVPLSSETRNILRLHEGSDGLRVPVEDLAEQQVFPALLEEVWNAPHPIDNSLTYARLGCLLARVSGSRVVLDGADGDTEMSSRHSLAGTLAVSGHPLRALHEARLASRVNTYLQGMSPARILLYGLFVALEPAWFSCWRYRRQAAVNGPWIDEGFARHLRLRERRLAAAVAARRDRSRLSSHELRVRNFWNPGVLRALEGTDRTYGRYGMEAWHPWCDQRVVDLLLNVPEDLLARDGWTKWLARKASAPVLGDDVVWYSGKSHLGSRLTPILVSAGHARVTELLAQAPDLLAGVVDADTLMRLRKAWEATPIEAVDVVADDAMHIATLVGWMDRYRLQVG